MWNCTEQKSLFPSFQSLLENEHNACCTSHRFFHESCPPPHRWTLGGASPETSRTSCRHSTAGVTVTAMDPPGHQVLELWSKTLLQLCQVVTVLLSYMNKTHPLAFFFLNSVLYLGLSSSSHEVEENSTEVRNPQPLSVPSGEACNSKSGRDAPQAPHDEGLRETRRERPLTSPHLTSPSPAPLGSPAGQRPPAAPARHAPSPGGRGAFFTLPPSCCSSPPLPEPSQSPGEAGTGESSPSSRGRGAACGGAVRAPLRRPPTTASSGVEPLSLTPARRPSRRALLQRLLNLKRGPESKLLSLELRTLQVRNFLRIFLTLNAYIELSV